MNKFCKELVWHNCVNCQPGESSNDRLYVTDGKELFEVAWRDNNFWSLKDNLPLNVTSDFWWADFVQSIPRDIECILREKRRNEENRNHLIHIRRELESIVNGEVYKCPECGKDICIESVDDLPKQDDKVTLPCGCLVDEYETDWLERKTIYDYLEDIYDEKCIIDKSDDSLYGVRIMVACGGPNIFIDTFRKTLELYWWNDTATIDLDSDICNEINNAYEEIYNC